MSSLKQMERRNKVIIVIVISLMIVITGVSMIIASANNREQSDVCRKWEELKRYNEQLRKTSDPEIQQGVSITQVQEAEYRRLCQEMTK